MKWIQMNFFYSNLKLLIQISFLVIHFNCIEFHQNNYNETKPVLISAKKIDVQVIPEKANQSCDRDFKEPAVNTFLNYLQNDNLTANTMAEAVIFEKCEKEKSSEIKVLFLANFALTLWSWGLIPCYANHKEKAIITLSYKNKVIKNYEYENSTHTIIWLFFFPKLFLEQPKPYEKYLSSIGQDIYNTLQQVILKQEEENQPKKEIEEIKNKN